MQVIQPFQSLEACFGELADPRVVGRYDHIFIEIILVAVCGSESWSEIEEFGNAKQEWLKQYLEMPEGGKCHLNCT